MVKEFDAYVRIERIIWATLLIFQVLFLIFLVGSGSTMLIRVMVQRQSSSGLCVTSEPLHLLHGMLVQDASVLVSRSRHIMALRFLGERLGGGWRMVAVGVFCCRRVDS